MNTKRQIEIDNVKIISNIGNIVQDLCMDKNIPIKNHLIRCGISKSEIDSIINDDFDNIDVTTLRKIYHALGIMLFDCFE